MRRRRSTSRSSGKKTRKGRISRWLVVSPFIVSCIMVISLYFRHSPQPYYTPGWFRVGITLCYNQRHKYYPIQDTTTIEEGLRGRCCPSGRSPGLPVYAGVESSMSELYSFGAWVRQRRRALDLTRDELAAHIGCSVVTIRYIEADERR